ncbi:hypothetical protein HDV05_003849 [Chytridiales sp. JEL 0842]|nr:hypothetical protein HDV05_003849 [Chytridiales sp. JEL 0842]
MSSTTTNAIKKILVVGGVAGGATAAARLRRLSETCAITVFEKGPYVSFANCGLPYYIGNVIQSQSSLLLANPTLFRERFNIDVKVLHQVLGIDRKQKTISVLDLQTKQQFNESYDYLILSPGAIPFLPPQIKNAANDPPLPGVFTVRTVPDSQAIKDYITSANVKKAAIVGGGFIGVEMAENFAHLGLETYIIERSNYLLPPFDSEMVSELPPYLAEKGNIQFLSGLTTTGVEKATPTSNEESSSPLSLTFANRDPLHVDLVILAVGVRPDTTLAVAAGLEIGSTGGIKTDNTMRTSDPSIYAVGDAVETTHIPTNTPTLIPLAGPANRQGRVAADAILSRPTTYRGIQGTAVCKAFDMVLACTGASEKLLQRLSLPYEKVHLYPKSHVPYYPNSQPMHLKILFHPQTGKIWGAQCVGFEGVDKRIDVLSMAIQSGLTVEDLEEAELCYAPQVGAAKDVVNLGGMVGSNVVRGDAPVVHWTDVKKAIEAKDEKVAVLDVRNKGEWEAKHVNGALHIPLHELRVRMNEVPKDKTLYVHCAVGQRGYYATRMLRLNGYDARNVSGGMSSLGDYGFTL